MTDAGLIERFPDGALRFLSTVVGRRPWRVRWSTPSSTNLTTPLMSRTTCNNLKTVRQSRRKSAEAPILKRIAPQWDEHPVSHYVS
jgi:hypothetical protein